MMKVSFFRATQKHERDAINLFLTRHNQRGQGSITGYVAYYAAAIPDSGQPLVDRLIAAAKFCPLHTPQAAKFFAGDDWRHVYCLQRLAALHPPQNLLSKFLAWCLKQIGGDSKVWYVATYAATDSFNPNTGRPHDGGIYRATNAVYCGQSEGGKVEAFVLGGQRRSMRRGPETLTLADIPDQARVIRSAPKHRYCWAVGPRLARYFRRVRLETRMSRFTFEPIYQPRLLARLLDFIKKGWYGSVEKTAATRAAATKR